MLLEVWLDKMLNKIKVTFVQQQHCLVPSILRSFVESLAGEKGGRNAARYEDMQIRKEELTCGGRLSFRSMWQLASVCKLATTWVLCAVCQLFSSLV